MGPTVGPPEAVNVRGNTRRILGALIVAATVLAGTLVTNHAGAAPSNDNVVTLHVDDVTLTADSDWPDGTTAKPFPEIKWAVAHAQDFREDGHAVRILVQPGVYRETVTIGSAGANPPLAIESTVPGGAVVTGSDVEQRWTPVTGTAYFDAPWTENWGLSPVPSSWNREVPDGVRRREAVFIDGRPLVQVLSEAELTAPNTFYVDEDADRIRMHPPAGVTDLGDHIVEVARRDRALRIQGQAKSITVRGLVFEAAAAPFEDHMVYVTDASNVVFERNTFRHSSWSGLGFASTTDIAVRGNRAVDNGGNGIDTYRTTRALLESNHMSGNNVRGARHGWVGWSVAASKHLLVADATFRDNTYTGNFARGLWLDTDVRNVRVVGDRSCNNARDGLFIEATQGPVTIEDTVYCNNGGAGILVGTSANITVRNTTMAGNDYGQLVFAGDRSRQFLDRFTGGLIEIGDFENWGLHGNTFTSTDDTPLIYSPVIPIDEWRQLLENGEIKADDNTWNRPTMEGAIRIRNENFPMEEWRALTGDEPPDDTDGHGFTDIAGNTHEAMIAAIAERGITAGCTTDGTRYCPAAHVTRGQMATFLRRALDLPAASGDHFPDDEDSVHEDSINRAAEAGIAKGNNGRFDPGASVTREQMASFLARGFDLPPSETSYPDVSPAHAESVGAIEDAGITKGCNAEGTRFCGDDPVRRDQMASFLGRALTE